MPECTKSFISQEKDKEKVPKLEVKHVIEKLFLLFEVIARENLGKQGKWARKHARHVIT